MGIFAVCEKWTYFSRFSLSFLCKINNWYTNCVLVMVHTIELNNTERNQLSELFILYSSESLSRSSIYIYIYQAINYSQHKGIRSKYNDAIMRGPFLFFYNTKSLTRIGFYVHSIFWRFRDPFDIRDFKGLVYLKPQTHIQPPLKNIWEYLSSFSSILLFLWPFFKYSVSNLLN